MKNRSLERRITIWVPKPLVCKQKFGAFSKGPVKVLVLMGQLRHQFVHNVLHGAIEADVLQGMGLVDDVVAGGAGLLLLQVLHQAALAD